MGDGGVIDKSSLCARGEREGMLMIAWQPNQDMPARHPLASHRPSYARN